MAMSINQAGESPGGGAWLFGAGWKGLPTAGIALSALDLGSIGGAHALGFLGALVEERTQIPECRRFMVDIHLPRTVRVMSPDRNGSLLFAAEFSSPFPRAWVKSFDQQSHILVLAYEDVFLATHFFEHEDSVPIVVRRMYRLSHFAMVQIARRLQPDGRVTHYGPLSQYDP